MPHFYPPNELSPIPRKEPTAKVSRQSLLLGGALVGLAMAGAGIILEGSFWWLLSIPVCSLVALSLRSGTQPPVLW